MKRAMVVLWGVVFSLALFMGHAQAADKLGYIDLSRTYNEYKKTKTYDKLLTDKEKIYTDERDKRIAEIKSFQDKLNLLNDKQKDEKQGELQAKAKALQDFDRQRQGELRKDQDERMKEILKDIEDAVKKYSEKEGYVVIFNDRVLVYQNKNMDITGQIIDILNKGN